jgi:hypothetical protein
VAQKLAEKSNLLAYDKPEMIDENLADLLYKELQ